MIKADLVNKISKETGVEKVTVKRIVEAFMENIKEAVIANDSVHLRGFGSFTAKARAEKTARDISKNKTIVVPAHSIPAFKPAKVFLDAVKEKVK
ncbi:MAG: integration host factor subunit beta [Bacteroidia bacterium]|nr:MAG: integration host factor subunit beta [Bacteroidia bacterium]